MTFQKGNTLGTLSGPPRRSLNELSSVKFSLWVTPTEAEAIRATAAERGMTVTALIRNATLAELDRS